MRGKEPDLVLVADGNNDDPSAAFSDQYEIASRNLTQWSSFLKPIFWKDTGRVASVPDLAGSSLVVGWAGLGDTHFELKCLWLEVSKGHFIDIDGKSFKAFSIPEYNFGAPDYQFTFPQDLDSLGHSCSKFHP